MLLQFLLIFDCMLKQKLNKSNPHKEVLYSQPQNNLFDGLCSKNNIETICCLYDQRD